MKINKLIFFAILLIAISIFSEERTLVGSNLTSGGFGCVSSRLTTIDGNFAVMIGGRGGWIIDHKFSIGYGSYELWEKIDADPVPGYDDDLKLDFGYRGIEFEYIHRSEALYHFTARLLVGWGEARLVNTHNDGDRAVLTDGLFVSEITLGGELNLTSWMRSYIAAGYHRSFDVDIENYNEGDFSGPSMEFGLKFGGNM
ncbi:hypothetical protein KAH81_03895 [bacterium]|nr:hypothetical protein [bacterium]